MQDYVTALEGITGIKGDWELDGILANIQHAVTAIAADAETLRGALAVLRDTTADTEAHKAALGIVVDAGRHAGASGTMASRIEQVTVNAAVADQQMRTHHAVAFMREQQDAEA